MNKMAGDPFAGMDLSIHKSTPEDPFGNTPEEEDDPFSGPTDLKHEIVVAGMDPDLPALVVPKVSTESTMARIARERKEASAFEDEFAAWRTAQTTLNAAGAAEIAKLSIFTGVKDFQWIQDNLPVVRKQVGKQRMQSAMARNKALAKIMKDPAQASRIRADAYYLDGFNWLLSGWKEGLDDYRSEIQFAARSNLESEAQVGEGLAGSASTDFTEEGVVQKAFTALHNITRGPMQPAALFGRVLSEVGGLTKDTALLGGQELQITPAGVDYVTRTGDQLGELLAPFVPGAEVPAAAFSFLTQSFVRPFYETQAEFAKRTTFFENRLSVDYGADTWLQGSLVQAPKTGADIGVDAGVSLAGGALAGPAGLFLAGFAWNKFQFKGSTYRTLRNLKNKDGTPLLNHDQAWAGAEVGSTAIGAVLSIPAAETALAIVGAKKGALSGLTQKVLGSFFEKAYAKNRVVGALLENGTEFVGDYTTGVTTMGAQSALLEINVQAVKALHGQDFDLGAVLDSGARGMLDSMQSLLFVSAARPSARFVSSMAGYGNLLNSTASQGILAQEELMTRNTELVQDALARGDTKEATKILDTLFQDGEVLLDKDALDAYWEEQGVDPKAQLELIFGDPTVHDTGNEDGFYRVSKGQYALISKGNKQQILNFAKLKESELTLAQIAEFDKRTKEIEAELRKDAEARGEKLTDLESREIDREALFNTLYLELTALDNPEAAALAHAEATKYAAFWQDKADRYNADKGKEAQLSGLALAQATGELTVREVKRNQQQKDADVLKQGGAVPARYGLPIGKPAKPRLDSTKALDDAVLPGGSIRSTESKSGKAAFSLKVAPTQESSGNLAVVRAIRKDGQLIVYSIGTSPLGDTIAPSRAALESLVDAVLDVAGDDTPVLGLAKGAQDSPVAGVMRGRGMQAVQAPKSLETASTIGRPDILAQGAFHGTGFKETFEKFLLEKIGTGEGAQVRGWGLYFASLKNVARGYQEKLSQDNVDQHQGQLLEVDIPESVDLLDSDKQIHSQSEKVVAALAPVLAALDAHRDATRTSHDGPRDSLENLTGEDIYFMLVGAANTLLRRTELTAKLQSLARDPKEAASRYLLENGIPGLQFLDQGSRDAGEGTHNFVIWDETAIEIKQQVADILAAKEVASAGGGKFTMRNAGQIEFGVPGIDGARSIDIKLFSNYGVDTVVHELGHYYLEAMVVLSGLDGANADLIGHTEGLLKWMGFSDKDAYLAENTERRKLNLKLEQLKNVRAAFTEDIAFLKGKKEQAGLTKTEAERLETLLKLKPPKAKLAKEDAKRLKHLTAKMERFAVGMEIYTRRGEAPSIDLVGAFYRVREGMLAIYKGYKQILQRWDSVFPGEPQPRLSDDVTNLFDRLFANQDAINQRREGVFADLDDALAGDPSDAFPKAMSKVQQQAEDALLDKAGFPKASARVVTDGFHAGEIVGDSPEGPATGIQRGAPQRAEIEAARKKARVLAEKQKAFFDFEDQAKAEAKAEGAKDLFDARMVQAQELATAELADSQLHDTQELILLGGKDAEAGLFHSKLDRAKVDAILGEEGHKTLQPHSTVKRTGRDPADIAAQMGWDSPQAMLAALAGAPSREEAAAARAQEIMQETYPLAHKDPGKLADLAAEAVVGAPAVLEAILAAQQAMHEALGGEGKLNENISDAALAGWATARAESLAGKKLRPGVKDNGVKSALARFAKALEAGDLKKAEKAILDARMRWHLAKTTKKAKKSLEAIDKRNRKNHSLAQQAKLGKQAPVVLTSVDALYAALGWAKSKVPEGGEMRSIEPLLRQEEADGVLVELVEDEFGTSRPVARQFDSDILDSVLKNQRRFSDLSLREARAMDEALKAVRHIAANLDTITFKNETLHFKEVSALLATAIRANLPKLAPSRTLSQSDPRLGAQLEKMWQKVRSFGQETDGRMLQMLTLVDFIDGLEEHGVGWETLYKPLLDARLDRSEMAGRIGKKIRALFDAMPADTKKRRFDYLPEDVLLVDKSILDRGNIVHKRWTRLDLMVMALNMGNEGNTSRLLGGYNWTQGQMMDALTHPEYGITPEEGKMIQGIWDAMAELYPAMSEVNRRQTGFAAGRVPAVPLALRGFTLEGGYFPAREEAALAANKPLSEARELKDMITPPGSVMPGVAHGHAKSRAEGHVKALSLDWGTIELHLTQVIQDITHREAVQQVGRLLIQPDVVQALEAHMGKERAQFLMRTLKGVAHSQVSEGPAEHRMFQKAMMFGRASISVAALGHNTAVAAGDATNVGLALAAGDVKAKHLLPWLAKAVPGVGYRDARARVLKDSRVMRDREQDLGADMAKQLGLFGKGSGKLAAVRETAFWLFTKTDALTTTPVWLAAYDESFADGASHGDAVEHADRVILKHYPAYDALSQSNLIGDKVSYLSAITVFYSFMNQVYQNNRRLAHQAYLTHGDPEASRTDKAVTDAKVFGHLLAYWTVYKALGDLFMGRGPDEGEDWSTWYMRSVLVAGADSIPMAGPTLETGVRVAQGKERAFSPSARVAPAFSFGGDAYRDITKLFEEGQDDKAFLLIKLIGLFTTLPVRPLVVNGKAVKHLFTGETRVDSLPEGVSAVLFGDSEHKLSQTTPLHRPTE